MTTAKMSRTKQERAPIGGIWPLNSTPWIKVGGMAPIGKINRPNAFSQPENFYLNSVAASFYGYDNGPALWHFGVVWSQLRVFMVWSCVSTGCL